MDANLVFLLCLALILAANKVDGEAEVSSISNSNLNLTDTNVTDSKNMAKLGQVSNTKGSDGDSSKSSEGNRESNKEDEAVSNSSSRKKQGEECDPSNMCRDEEDQFVACLRVPGNDAPHLSLLIQNKGKNALLVTITATAPGFVQLEKNKVELLENQDTKVKVSIKKGGSNDSAIRLASGKGHCSLELKDLAGAHETGNDDDTVVVSRPWILNMRPRTLIVIIIIISFLLLSLVIIPMIIHVYRRNKSSQGNKKYQRLDMELPVTNTGLVTTKSEQETGDDDGSWNNNWGDDWDDENGHGDEEQPNTPVLPLTPSVSSRGLASRRLSKEGWKD
uniref:DUF7356 domain-containing protein n=1 Tax=Noccaea caerulescens TaxID=107243 RepID=A0A1J3IKI9_NOCCA